MAHDPGDEDALARTYEAALRTLEAAHPRREYVREYVCARREAVPAPPIKGPVPTLSLEALLATAPTRYGRWRQAYSGRPIWPLDPRPGDFLIDDLARHLASIPRYGGAQATLKHQLSVAQHSVAVSYMGSPAYARHKLVHDMAEAITGVDMPAPIKSDRALASWRAIEDRCQEALLVQLGLDPHDTGDTAEMDRRILEYERVQVMRDSALPWPGQHALLVASRTIDVDPLPRWDAYTLFVVRFSELFPGYPIY